MLKFVIHFRCIKNGRMVVDRAIIPADHIDTAVEKIEKMYDKVQIISAKKFNY